MLINNSYFTGDLNIPNVMSPDVASSLNTLISKREKEYLIRMLGYELYSAFTVGITQATPNQRFLDILIGQQYTGYNGHTHKWDGLVASTIDNTLTSVKAVAEIFFTVGITGAPIDGATTYVNTTLAGLSYSVAQRVLGALEILKSDNSNIATADISIQSTGGFTLLKGQRFSSGDKYLITLAKPIITTTDTSVALAPSSPIADYCYYYWLAQKHTLTSGIGQVKAKGQNNVVVSEKYKACAAWNSMVDKSVHLYYFLHNSGTIYPEFTPNNQTVGTLLTKIHPYY